MKKNSSHAERKSNDSRWSNQTCLIYQRKWWKQIWIPVLKHWRTCIRHQWHVENAWTCSWWTWKAWHRHKGPAGVQRRLFTILKSKKKYIEWHFCHHMYFSSLKLFEVLKFFQFLMLFENQFLDTSSNFGAPKDKNEIKWLQFLSFFFILNFLIQEHHFSSN